MQKRMATTRTHRIQINVKQKTTNEIERGKNQINLRYLQSWVEKLNFSHRFRCIETKSNGISFVFALFLFPPSLHLFLSFVRFCCIYFFD